MSLDNKPLNNIKSWAAEDRPREKLMQKGKQSLTDAELLAILIGSGNQQETAVDLCKRLLKDAENDLAILGKKNLSELMHYKGIGEAKAISIIAALELGTRRRLAEVRDRQQITSSRDAFDILQPHFSDLSNEEFWIVMLNRANKVIGKECISAGGVSGTTVDVKIVFKKAIQSLASGIILCHNHPSGSLQPSQADRELTRRMAESGKLLEINVLDHLIVTDHANNYFSFADEGLL
jgi:DNA repair protein RadC